MQIDWGDGEYETTGAQLVEAAARAVQVAGVEAGERVLDVGCGTGNVALEAARRGAVVMAVDPAARLLQVTRERAARAALSVSVALGDGARIDADSDQFDAVLAVFSVIFAPDPAAVVAELVRVTRPGGRIVVATWRPEGAVHESSLVFAEDDVPRQPSPWGTPDSLRALFAAHSAEVAISDERIAFAAPSAEAWFADLERHHPAWRAVRGLRADAWDGMRARALDILAAGNEDPTGFRVTSNYLLARANLPTAP